MPNFYFGTFEAKLGLIFACGPALRQFFAYRERTHSWLPTNRRQYPNEDFEKMRLRINLRDLLWYRSPPSTGNNTLNPRAIVESKSSPPPDAMSGNPESKKKVIHSIIDFWERRAKNKFWVRKSQEVSKDERRMLFALSIT